MAVLYPNDIVNVFIRGVEFTGNMVSVGQDGLYPYDYSNISSAIAAEPAGSLILVYPGSWVNPSFVVTKDMFIRGMGTAPEQVYFRTDSGTWHTITFNGNLKYAIIENIESQADRAWSGALVFRDCNTLADIYLNKLILRATNSGYTIYFGDTLGATSDYQGDAWVSYCTIVRGYAHLREVGRGSTTSTISLTGIEYQGGTYYCDNCARDPSPHIYSIGPSAGTGHTYGDNLIEFNILPPLPPLPDDPLYQNVWVVGEKIYHTTNTGVDVYNSDVSSLVHHIPLPNAATSVWANDEYVYMGTLSSGVYRSTASGVAIPYIKTPLSTSDNTIYIHGAGEYLCLTTFAGVDRYDLSTASGTTMSGVSRIFTYDQYIHKCFQTVDGTLYYLENNLFFNVDESVAGLGRPLREWKYYQLLQFSVTSIDNAQVRVQFTFDFPYQNVKDGGADLRFIDSRGNNLNYYIESWYPSASVLVKIVAAGSDHMYMLYGNAFAESQSSIADAYYFYDDFSTLDPNVWVVLKGHSNNYAVITSGYLDIYDYNNSGTAVVTNVKLPYSLTIKARIRRRGGTDTNQMDNVIGYINSPSKNRPNRGYVRIDCIQNPSDDVLHYLHAYDTSVQGAKALSTTWYVWEAVWAPGYQKSIYREETLERTSTDPLFDTSNYFSFHIDNSSSNPNLNVDWVSMETWPENITLTTTEQLLWELIHPKLHAVYTPNSNWPSADHVYEEFYGDPLLINDIHVTEGTSSHNNDNVILLATNRGAHIIEELRGDEENANKKRYYIS